MLKKSTVFILGFFLLVFSRNILLGFEFSEDFTTTVYQDTSTTTALWNTDVGEVILPPREEALWEISLSASTTIYSVSAVNSQVLWGVGNSIILHSNDGGNTWTQQFNLSSHGAFGCVSAINETVAWAGGEFDAVIHHTQDGGNTWIKQDNLPLLDIFGMCAVDPTTVWVVGPSGNIFYTTDSGTNWLSQNSGVSIHLYDIAVANSRTAWAAGANGTILFTNDAGASWNKQESPVTNYLYGVCVINNSTAWIVGTGGTILHTDNGGVNWTKQNSGIGENLFSVSAVNNSNVWAAGDNATVLHTNDGGLTWRKQTVNTEGGTYHLYSISTPNLITAFAAGHGSAIFKYNDSYSAQAVAQSLKLNTFGLTSNIYKATLTTDEILNDLIINYFLSADGGVNWEAASKGIEHIFHHPGRDLRWKAELRNPNSSDKTPILKRIYINYSMLEETPIPIACNIKIFPNPYQSTKDWPGQITFSNLPKEALIRIFTISGELVKKIQHNAPLNGRNEIWDVEGIPSGIYIYQIESSQGNSKGKLSILK